MVNGTTRRLLRIGLLALVMCLLGAVLLGGVAGFAAPGTPADDAPLQAGSSQGTCYTIDTARPEWLGNWTAVYLLVITKSLEP